MSYPDAEGLAALRENEAKLKVEPGFCDDCTEMIWVDYTNDVACSDPDFSVEHECGSEAQNYGGRWRT